MKQKSRKITILLCYLSYKPKIVSLVNTETMPYVQPHERMAGLLSSLYFIFSFRALIYDATILYIGAMKSDY